MAKYNIFNEWWYLWHSSIQNQKSSLVEFKKGCRQFLGKHHFQNYEKLIQEIFFERLLEEIFFERLMAATATNVCRLLVELKKNA